MKFKKVKIVVYNMEDAIESEYTFFDIDIVNTGKQLIITAPKYLK